MTPNRDNDQAVQLAERLLAHPHPLGGYPTVELFPGRVPDDAGIDLVIPSFGRLLGTAVERRDGKVSGVQAIVDIDQPRTAAMEACIEELRRAGWTDAYFGSGTGFIPSSGGPPQIYQKNESGPMLMVHAVPRSANATELRLRVDYSSPPQPLPRHERPEAMELMPALYAPPGVDMEGGGGGGGDGYWSSHATAKTSMPLPELEAFFSTQLSRDGWTRLSGASADVMTWSYWRVAGGDDWRALLIVLASPEDDERWLTVHMQRPSRPHAGWRGAF